MGRVSRFWWIVLLIGCVALVYVLAPELFDQPPPVEYPGTPATVSYVFDGDTIEVRTDKGKWSVRFLGIDAPEMGQGKGPNECGAADATNELRRILPKGTRIHLITDKNSQDKDRFNRLLRYVEVDGEDVGKMLIDKGLVGAWHPRSDGTPERFDSYRKAASTAKSSKTGSWAVCPSLGR